MTTITIREVALLAGVSQSTAARALNGYGSVSAKTSLKVSQAAQQLGYRTNSIAQALRRGQAQFLGFVPSDLQNPFFSTVGRNVADRVESEGYTLLIASSDEEIDRERRIIENLRSSLVSGIIVAPAPGADRSHLLKLGESGIPLTLIDRMVPGLAADVVKTENVGGAVAAIEHLLSLGHRRIALLNDDLRIYSATERLEGFRTAMARHGVMVDDTLIVSVRSSYRENGYQAAYDLLARPDRPTAAFAGDNILTLSAVRAAHDLGLRIPDDLSIVGFDDFDLATALQPALTVIAQPIAELGKSAAELMLKRLDGWAEPPVEVSLPTSLIIRGSTASPPRADTLQGLSSLP